MFRLLSLSAKIKAVSLVFLLAGLASVSSTLWVTWQLAGGAASYACHARIASAAVCSTSMAWSDSIAVVVGFSPPPQATPPSMVSDLVACLTMDSNIIKFVDCLMKEAKR